MNTDVLDLIEFYKSPLGKTAQGIIGQHIKNTWPSLRGKQVVAVGFGAPFLTKHLGDAAQLSVLTPAGQEIPHHKTDKTNISYMNWEERLPFNDESVDCVILSHGLETKENPQPLLREIWRVLVGGGKLLIIVPNRLGMWARADRTPFGHGVPYSPLQLTRTLRQNLFEPQRQARALFVPPFINSSLMLATAPLWEKIGKTIFPTFAGVLLCDSAKQLYAPIGHSALSTKKQHFSITPKRAGT